MTGYGTSFAGWFAGCPDLWRIRDVRRVAAEPLLALASARADGS